jgi:tetratricopeptide (TPR) repeat protein
MPLAGMLGLSAAALAKPPPPAPAPATIGDLARRSVEVHPDASVNGSPAKAMQSYRSFLELQNTDPKLRAEALRRLADLNMESGELERMSSEVSQLDLQGAEAIKLYATLLKAYPDYPRNDQVLYQLARAYETTGQRAEALAALDQVVRRYPATRDIAEVQFRRGELLFSDQKYADAQVAYEQVIARGAGGSTFYDQSLYKHGWSLFKQAQNEESLRSFAALLDRTLLDRQSGAARSMESLSRADRELADDALRAMSIAFSYLDGAKSIDALLARRGPSPYAWLLYSRLGDLYVQKQRFQDAATTYRAFVARDPVNVHAPALTNQAIDAYSKGGFADLVVEGKSEYVRSYGFKTAFWQGRQRAAFPQVAAELKSNFRDLAQYFHATAQKSKKPEDYATAARWYRDYLAEFPDDADSIDTNYLLADALFEGHQYAEAAAEYEHTAYGYPVGARSAAAGYAGLVAYQKHEEQLAPAARPEWHARATDAGVHFAASFPAHPESAGVLTRAAQDVFAAHDLPRAMALAEDLLARQPPVDVAKQRIGWTIIGQAQFELADFVKSEAAFTHALAVTPASAPEHGDITERLAAAVYKQGDAKRKAGDDTGAAADFLRVALAAPGSKVVSTAAYDAAAALINAKQWDRAIEVLEAYRRGYPKSEYEADITRKLAVAYVEAGRGAKAAAEFERIAATPGEEPAVAREATLRAADLYEKAGNAQHAQGMLEQFVQRYPTPVLDAEEARARLSSYAANAHNLERLRYWQSEIIKADAGAGAARTDRTRSLAATASLALAAPARDAFRGVRLSAPLKKSLSAKKQAMETALAGYQAVIGYDVAATTTAATYEMAELYRTLAKDLLASERPKKLSADERETYDSLLEEQAFPFEEQAITIHQVNVRRAQDGIYDDAVRDSYRALAELSPARFAKSETTSDLLRTLDPPAGTPLAPGAVHDFTHGVANLLSGRPTEAELDFRQMELQYPTLAEPSINLGIVTRDEGKLEASATALQRATGLVPGNPRAWDELGLTLRAQGKFADARTAYQRAIAADASYAPAHRNLAVLLDLYLADPAAALVEFEHYHQLTGEDKAVAGWIAELRRRTGVKPPAAPAPAGTPAIAPPAAQNAGNEAGAAAGPGGLK